jgi:hypothetical protein
MINLFVLEWSGKQRCFHVQTLDESVKQNLRCALREKSSDYIIIGLFATRDEVIKATELLRKEKPEVFGEIKC